MVVSLSTYLYKGLAKFLHNLVLDTLYPGYFIVLDTLYYILMLLRILIVLYCIVFLNLHSQIVLLMFRNAIESYRLILYSAIVLGTLLLILIIFI